MRKRSRYFVTILLFASVLLFVPSCKDDEPAPPGEISFTESEITVKESDGIIEVEITLSKPAKEDITIEYELSGTAIDVISGGFDYEILSDYLEVEIEEGETTGIIEIELYSDFAFESTPETIEIELSDVDSDAVEISNDDEIEISIEQEDGLGIVLEWTGNVDMDLFLWAEDNSSTLVWTEFGSTNIGFAQKFETMFLPSVMDDGNYGISCNYYEGTVTPLNFTVTYRPFVNGTFGTNVVRNGTYTLANINAWDQPTGTDPLLAATYTKSGSTYSNFSQITVHPAGSRVTSGNFQQTLKKGFVTRDARVPLNDR
jgi:hypothetical protein